MVTSINYLSQLVLQQYIKYVTIRMLEVQQETNGSFVQKHHQY